MELTRVKCVLLGDEGVGKTCLLFSYTSNSFPTENVPTVLDNYSANVLVDDQTFFLELWDMWPSNPKNDRLRPLCYPRTSVVLLCFSVVDPTSLSSARNMVF